MAELPLRNMRRSTTLRNIVGADAGGDGVSDTTISNKLIARQAGGTAGTDDLELTHNGTSAFVRSLSGTTFIDGGNDATKMVGFSSAGIIPNNNNQVGIGSATNGFNNIFVAADAAVTNVTSGDSALQYVDVAVSSAEILALNATPKELVAAPGANKILSLERVVFFLDYNSAAYAGIAAGEDLAIRYGAAGDVVAFLETTGFLDATADQYRVVNGNTSTGAGAYRSSASTNTANQALNLEILSAEVTTGNSPMGVRVYYSTIDLSTLSAT